MAIDRINPAFTEPHDAAAKPELLVAAVLHLMSHYTVNSTSNYTANSTANLQERHSCVKLASVIERHLKALADLPTLAPVLRTTCRQLSEQWAAVVERTMPQPIKFTLFARIMSGKQST
ncbi:MAG: hypothetical protein JWQ10_2832 [Herbaspirillum sp.]|jgi:hypothetical protein|nr:hypothetical protein [Herbaspirillum sp.]